MPMRTYNLITEPLIRLRRADHSEATSSLPGTLAMLVGDEVAEFPALRPHQRHPWHAFLVQLAVIALHRAGATGPPADEQSWAKLLRALTPEWPDDEPWSLVAPADRPAFMQPHVPGGDLAPFKTVIETPDALDMLVTSKNHDLKGELMGGALPDDWLFALVSLQTMEGFMGQGNYGVSRMNGGFASRPAIGVLPPGGPGARFRRDMRMLLHGGRDAILRRVALNADRGIGLVWLLPWDGADHRGDGCLLAQGDEHRDTMRELQRPKVGRMARLKGTVEQVLPPLPQITDAAPEQHEKSGTQPDPVANTPLHAGRGGGESVYGKPVPDQGLAMTIRLIRVILKS